MVYSRVVKPVLFTMSPDVVHERMLRGAQLAGRVPGLPRMLRSVWRYDNSARLSQEIYGVPFPNPVGLAAGLDKNADLVRLLPSIGFGFGTVGSVTHQVCEGNPRPWFYRLPKAKSLVVHVGLANHGVKAVATMLKKQTVGLHGFPVVVSVAKTNCKETCSDPEAIDDYVGSLKLLKDEPSAQVLEINISCPNTYGGEPFTDPKRLEALLVAVDALSITKPIWVKMPINHAWPEFKALLEVIVEHNVQGVTIGNLNKDRTAMAIPAAELPPKVEGNLSGKLTQTLSDALIAQTYREYGKKLTIIGVGGIFTAEDAYRKLCLGASLVELITGMIFEGPQLIGHINCEITHLLAKDGFAHISAAVGSQNHRL